MTEQKPSIVKPWHMPHVEDRGDVQDRLDDLAEEQAHPEKREAIKQARLQHIQRRKSLNETP